MSVFDSEVRPHEPEKVVRRCHRKCLLEEELQQVWCLRKGLNSCNENDITACTYARQVRRRHRIQVSTPWKALDCR